MPNPDYFLQAKKNVISRWQPKAERKAEPWTLWRCLPGPKDKEVGPTFKVAWRTKRQAYKALQKRLGEPIVPWEDHPERVRSDVVALIDDHLSSVGARLSPPRPVKKNSEAKPIKRELLKTGIC